MVRPPEVREFPESHDDAGDIDIDLAAELPTPEPVGSSGGEAAEPRMSTGIEEVDRFFDGGLEPGTVAMIDGEPGAGKTTLLLQICSAFARRNPGATVLYVSGEQKTGTLDSVAARLELPPDPNFLRVTTNRWEHVEEIVERYDPALLVVDAIQVFRIARVGRPAGDVAQVRAVGVRIVTLAKGRSMSTFVVVHHNKAGGFAGPKVIEHLVDASASLDHVPGSDMRRLVQPKNRTADTSRASRRSLAFSSSSLAICSRSWMPSDSRLSRRLVAE
jgi:DNA repair protein RadA/Sms